MKKTLWTLALAAAALIGLPAAYATPITTTLNLGTVYTGSIPDGSAPWLVATFTSDTDSTTGTLTLTSMLSGPDFVKGTKNPSKLVSGWAFYLDPLVTSISCTSGTCADGTQIGGTINSGPVPGPFNLGFAWSAGEFSVGSSAVYTLTFASDLSGNPFVENSSGWSSVAHVQGINNMSCSGWIVSGDGDGADGGTTCSGTSVPEPANLGMFGLGLLMTGLLALGLRRRWQ